jgi:hypothetical protein
MGKPLKAKRVESILFGHDAEVVVAEEDTQLRVRERVAQILQTCAPQKQQSGRAVQREFNWHGSRQATAAYRKQ